MNSNVLAPESVSSVWLNVSASVAKSTGPPDFCSDVVSKNCEAGAPASPIGGGVAVGAGVGVGVGLPVLADQMPPSVHPAGSPPTDHVPLALPVKPIVPVKVTGLANPGGVAVMLRCPKESTLPVQPEGATTTPFLSVNPNGAGPTGTGGIGGSVTQTASPENVPLYDPS